MKYSMKVLLIIGVLLLLGWQSLSGYVVGKWITLNVDFMDPPAILRYSAFMSVHIKFVMMLNAYESSVYTHDEGMFYEKITRVWYYGSRE